MPFEQILRDHLLDDAEVVPLPERGDPGRAVTRARARRRHRLTAAAVATVAVVTAAGVAALPALRDDGGDTVLTPATGGALEATGPLDLAWASADGGLSGLQSQFQLDDGTVYALSTGPGAHYGDPTPLPQSVYRLDENGVWQPQNVNSEFRMQDVTGTGDALYGVATGPGTRGDAVETYLLRSDDDGSRWNYEEIEPAEPPSTSHNWQRYATMSVESSGPVTLAVVTTQFLPDVDALFPEAAGDFSYRVEPRDEGLTLVHTTGSEFRAVDPGAQPPATDAPTTTVAPARADSLTDDSTDTGVISGDGGATSEDVRTIPWSDLGISSRSEANLHVNQVFRLSGDAWEPVADDLPGGMMVGLGVAGDMFTAEIMRPATDETPPASYETDIYVSADGATWTRVEAPRPGSLVGTGPALVNAPSEGTSLDVSTDGGASWSTVDLAESGMAPDRSFAGGAGGPLGLAVVISGPGGPEALATSADLISWTITPLSEIAGTDDIATVTPFVGADRIVISVNGHSTGPDLQGGVSRTAVGTPRRS